MIPTLLNCSTSAFRSGWSTALTICLSLSLRDLFTHIVESKTKEIITDKRIQLLMNVLLITGIIGFTGCFPLFTDYIRPLVEYD